MAIASLVAEGLVVSRPGAGVFRAGDRPRTQAAGDVSWQEIALSAEAGSMPRAVDATGVLTSLATVPPEVIDLNSGYMHASLMPEQALGSALARAGRRPGSWARPPLEGLAELRGWFARDIAASLAASDVLIAAGGQSALSTAVRSLAAPGMPVLVESPTYPGLLAIARAAGLRPVPVPVDADRCRSACRTAATTCGCSFPAVRTRSSSRRRRCARGSRSPRAARISPPSRPPRTSG